MSISTPDNTICPLCGAPVEPNHRFCPTCAHPLSAITSESPNRVTGSATNLSDQAPAKPKQNSLTTQINKFLSEGQDPAAVRQAYQAVLKILSDQEEVSYIAVQKMPGLLDWSAAIVLTNNRLIVYHNNNEGQGELKDYRWADIRGFSKQETPTAITISFVTSGSPDHAIRIDHLSDVQGWKLYQYAIKKIKGHALSNTVYTDSKTSITTNPSILLRKFPGQFGNSESSVLSNTTERIIARRRNPAVVIALNGGLVLMLMVCVSLLVFSTVTDNQKKAQATATAQTVDALARKAETARVQAAATATAEDVVRQLAAVATAHVLGSTATAVTAVQQAADTATAVVVVATEQAITAQANATGTAQAIESAATSTAVAVIANATSTAEAKVINATSTAVAKAVNATSTAVAKAVNATATAGRKAYESYRTTAPKGDFSGGSQRVAIKASFQYQNCVASWCADKNSKFIVVGVVVASGSEAISVNPLYFTLISTDGYVVDVDTATYGMSNYLDAVNLQPNTYTNGYIAFITNKNFIPGRLVWQDFEGTVTVKIIDPGP